MYLPDTVPEPPSFAFVELRLGTENLFYTTETGPRYLVSFSYERRTDSEGNNWEFSIFDHDWDYVESLIAEFNQRLLFRYGYWSPSNDNVSPWYSGQVTILIPKLEIDGTIITFSGTTDYYAKSMNQNHEKKYRKWGGDNYQIHDIVKKICDDNWWYLKDYEKTKPVYDIDSLYESSPTHKCFHQLGVSDLAFIKNVIVPHAVSERSGRGGYRFWFDDEETAKTGYPVANFLPFDTPKDTIKTYRYMRGHFGYGEVIEWQPDLSLRWAHLISAFNNKMSEIDRYSKKSRSPRTTIITLAKYIGSGKAKQYTQEIVSGRVTLAGDFKYRVAQNENVTEIMVKTRQDSVAPYSKTAMMRIAGDPQIKPNTDIKVICLTNDGRLHYSSGIYHIMSITDLVDSSGFVSTLNLTPKDNPIIEMTHEDYDTRSYSGLE